MLLLLGPQAKPLIMTSYAVSVISGGTAEHLTRLGLFPNFSRQSTLDDVYEDEDVAKYEPSAVADALRKLAAMKPPLVIDSSYPERFNKP